MKTKEVYTGNISVSFVLFLGYYFSQYIIFFLIGMSILFLSMLSEPSAKIIAMGFRKLFAFLGAINSRIILSVFYLGVLFPISLLKRVFTKKEKRGANTNWIDARGKTYNFDELW